jgi:hypothetical protein
LLSLIHLYYLDCEFLSIFYFILATSQSMYVSNEPRAR